MVETCTLYLDPAAYLYVVCNCFLEIYLLNGTERKSTVSALSSGIGNSELLENWSDALRAQ